MCGQSVCICPLFHWQLSARTTNDVEEGTLILNRMAKTSSGFRLPDICRYNACTSFKSVFGHFRDMQDVGKVCSFMGFVMLLCSCFRIDDDTPRWNYAISTWLVSLWPPGFREFAELEQPQEPNFVCTPCQEEWLLSTDKCQKCLASDC